MEQPSRIYLVLRTVDNSNRVKRNRERESRQQRFTKYKIGKDIRNEFFKELAENEFDVIDENLSRREYFVLRWREEFFNIRKRSWSF